MLHQKARNLWVCDSGIRWALSRSEVRGPRGGTRISWEIAVETSNGLEVCHPAVTGLGLEGCYSTRREALDMLTMAVESKDGDQPPERWPCA